MATHQTAKTQYVSTPDGTINFAYRRFGTPSKDKVSLLFLIHFRGTMDKWDPLLINSIAQSRSVILVDYPGLGHSKGRVAHSFRESAADIATFLALLGVKEVDVLGFSIGGFVAQLLALNHGDGEKINIRKLIVCGSTASVGPDMPETGNDYKTAATRPELTVQEFKELFFPWTPEGERAAEEWWARTQERNERTSGGEAPSEWGSQGFEDGGAALMAQGEALANFFDVEKSKGMDGTYERLGNLKIPVLVAQGSDDKMIPTINSFHFQQKVPNGQLIVYPNSGHGFLYQYAELFAKQVNTFLDA